MYNIGNHVIYLRDVCRIADIKENYLKGKDYYTLVPINDSSLKLSVPVDNDSIKPLLTKKEINDLINSMLNIEPLDLDDKILEAEYKQLLQSGTHRDLIKIIKTTYLRNQKRLENKRKISDKDRNYFEMAEKYLYTEFSVVLSMSFEETKDYVIAKLQELAKNN